MKKEIIDVDKEKGIFRVTTSDERWYVKRGKSVETGLPVHTYYPSATWIVHYYYTSPFLIKWIAEKGLDEAETIKNQAGEKGSKIHLASEMLDMGATLNMGDKLMNHNKGVEEEITTEEWEAILSYKSWFDEAAPRVLATEMTIFNEKYGYAGTLDKIVAIPNKLMPSVRQIWILDIKTGKVVTEGHKMQISAYSHADIDYKKLEITEEEWANRKLCVLQLGYKLNKQGFKFTEIEDKFRLFLNTMESWKNENPNTKPRQIDLPISIKLDLGAGMPIKKETTKEVAQLKVAEQTESVEEKPKKKK